MSTPLDAVEHWPEHLPVAAVRFSRASDALRAAVQFYRDFVGLPEGIEARGD